MGRSSLLSARVIVNINFGPALFGQFEDGCSLEF